MFTFDISQNEILDAARTPNSIQFYNILSRNPKWYTSSQIITSVAVQSKYVTYIAARRKQLGKRKHAFKNEENEMELYITHDISDALV